MASRYQRDTKDELLEEGSKFDQANGGDNVPHVILEPCEIRDAGCFTASGDET